MSAKKITIITPTYNRAYILENAFISLKEQSLFDFEWIIVDDGSTDDTEKMVRTWCDECKLFSIKYFKRENGGKHRAVNHGVQMAAYEYILILDSDDILDKNCIKYVSEWIREIDENKCIAGVSGLRGWINKAGPIGKLDENDRYIDCTNLERRKYGLLGDKAEVYRTSIMKKYPFPEFDGENFIQESASWDRIAQDGYRVRWHRKIIYYCEYLDDGLTKGMTNDVFVKNFKGFAFCMKLTIDNTSFPLKFLRIGRYAEVAKLLNLSNREICNYLNISKFCLELSSLVYLIKNKLWSK